MRFKVKDNQGNIVLSKEYFWNKEDGIPNEETILENMEECTCLLSESNASCAGDCIMFDEGEVMEVIP